MVWVSFFGFGLHGFHATLADEGNGGSKVKGKGRGGGSPGLHKPQARKVGDTLPFGPGLAPGLYP